MWFRLLPLLCLALATARGELVWEKPAQEFHRAPEDLQLTAPFTFRNAGKEPVEITRIVTSCGCTAARPDKKSFAPGESGKIDVQFTFGGRQGEQRKTITVSTSDGHQTLLELKCVIEDALDVKPALVFWRKGDAPEEKTVALTANPKTRVTVTAVKSNDPGIEFTLETLEAGRQYAVHVHPKSTTERVTAQLTVQTDFPPDAPKSYTIFARVK